jgi:hypothetical protein
MHNRPPVAYGVRVATAGLTLAVHGVFVLVLLFEDRNLQDPLPASRKLAGMSIHLFSPPPPSMDNPPQSSRALARNQTSRLLPSSGITPAPQEEATTGVPVRSEAPSGIDWHAAADLLAARNARADAAPATFSAAPNRMREPCKPRDSSFDWHPEDKKYGLLPLPYIVIADRCFVTLGYFSCNLSPLPEPNKHLFDDMQQRRTPESSVPDPYFCD